MNKVLVPTQELELDFPSLKLPRLIPEQEAVVFSQDSNILVESGPATGKTRIVEACSKRKLIEGIDFRSIHPLTFTNIGTQEMNSRLRGLLAARTTHSSGYRDSVGGRKAFLLTGNFDELLQERVEGEPLYEWVICDEAQDLTRRQYKNLLSKGKHLILVGDRWQSLYKGWAGADPTIMDDFCRDYCGGRRYSLGVNHRSCSEIVKIGNKFSGRSMEWERVGGLIDTSGKEPPNLGDITILFRTGKEVKREVEHLRSRGVPHTWIHTESDSERKVINWKEGRVWKVKEIKDFLPTIVSTIHGYKGAESRRVWLVYRDLKMRDVNWENEVYIFYVGLTRAMDELYIYPETKFMRRL